MKDIEIEGIRLTEDMIEFIEYLQMNNGQGTDCYLNLMDRIIRNIAINANNCEGDPGKAEALGVIGELSEFRALFSIFSGKKR